MSLPPAKIPGSIRRILEEQRADLDALAPGHKARLLEIAERAAAGLEDRLSGVTPGSFTETQTSSVLAQVQAVIVALSAEYGDDMGEASRQIGEDAAAVARERLLERLDAWESEHAGTAQGSIRGTARPKLAAGLLDDGLLEYYESSRLRYGTQMLRQMRDSMALATLSGETLAQSWERMAKATGLKEWQAERIVRTEHSFAVHRRNQDDMRQLFGDDLASEWDKQLVTSFDDRTGEDSKFVDGQRVHWDEKFRDNEGRVYDAPPNRPNDREVMVEVPRDL